jgi:DNA-binding beta-propeller fold protein YncE
VRAALAAPLALLAACAAPAPRDVARSSTIVLAPEAGRLFVTSPDDDAVVVLDAEDGAELARWPVAGGPEQLTWDGRALLVTLGRRGALVRLEPASGAATEHPVPCGSTRAVVTLGARTFVSCPDDDRLVELDAAGAVIAVRSLAGAPSGLAGFGGTLGVALSRGGALVELEVDGHGLLDAPLRREALEVASGFAASSAEALSADPIGGFLLAFSRVDHDSDRGRDPARGGYGSVIDGAPRIAPRLRSACGDRYARFDGGALAQSGPSAVASAGGHLWITHLFTDGVVLADCAPDGSAPEGGPLAVRTTFAVGRAPRGIALSDDGATAFVDAGFDWAVSRLDAPTAAGARTAVTWTRRRARGETALSEAALRGRSLFFDAVDTHLTPSGVVTCGTCHPRGGEDGLSWFLHTEGVARRLRRTPPAWGARPALRPYHWDGEFGDGAVLSETTTHELMEGDGLLIDFPAIAAWLEELPLPAPRPVEDPAAVARGRALFEAAGCAACHAGPLYADGRLHAVLAPSADADASLAAASTPSLLGVRARAPYFHDGRAATLRHTLAVPADTHGDTSTLTEEERDALVVFLESL